MASAFQSDAFQSDTFESGGGATVEGSFTTAAVLLVGSGTQTFAADGAILLAQPGSFTANAWIGGVTTGGFSLDAVISAEQAGSFTANAVILQSGAASAIADALLRIVVPASFQADAVLKKTIGAGRTYRTKVLEDGPINYWRLEETSGTTAVDIGSIPSNGTIKSSVTKGVAAPTPIGGTAFSFPGNTSTGYVYASAISVARAAYSIEAWFKSAGTGSGGIAGRWNSNAGVFIFQSGGLVYAYIGGSSIGKTFTANVWNHVVITFDGTNAKIYVNAGTPASFGNATPTNPAATILFGIGGYSVSSGSAPGAITASIDEVAYYTYALNATQIADHYAGTSSNVLGFAADAVLKKEQSGSFTGDAIRRKTTTAAFAADAVIQPGFSLNACFRGVEDGRFTANAYFNYGFFANAFFIGTRVWSFSAAAYIGTTNIIFWDDFDRTVTEWNGFGNSWVSQYGTSAVNGYGYGQFPDSYDNLTNPDIPAAPSEFDLYLDFRTQDIDAIDGGYYEYLYIQYGPVEFDFWPDTGVHANPFTLTFRSYGTVPWPGIAQDIVVNTLTWYTIRVNRTPSTVNIKVWKTGDTEPVAWLVSDTVGAYDEPFFMEMDSSFVNAFWVDNLLILAPPPSFTADAVIAGPPAFTADAVIAGPPAFTADAVITKPAAATFTAKSWFEIATTVQTGSFSIDSWVIGTVDYFAANAYIISQTKLRSLSADSDIVSTTDRRNAFNADAWVLANQEHLLTADAVVAAPGGFISFDAVLKIGSGTKTLAADAIRLRTQFGAFFFDADIRALGSDFSADAVIYATAPQRQFTARAWITLSTQNALVADGVIVRSAEGEFSMLALLVRSDVTVFTADASIMPRLTADAFIQPYFTANAYIRGETVRVFPPGGGGSGGIDSLPTRDFAISVTVDGADVTEHVLWAETEFIQAARVAPGSFRLSLLGSWPYDGGEKVLVAIDDLLTYGGYVTIIERTYVFEDVAVPKTVLHGPDFNILFDKLVVYNKAFAVALGPIHWGPYDPMPAWPKATQDGNLIKKFCRDYLDVPNEMDFTAYVENVGTANPATPGTIESGVSWREFMTEQSRMTHSVWWIDPYMNLHNHSRSKITAPYAITDGDDGIGSRGLYVRGDISRMITEDIVWGTLARDVSGKTIYSHQMADANMTADYYASAAEQISANVAALEAITNRTADQNAALATDLATLASNLAQQEAALANPDADAVGSYGRWQHAEFRSDIHTKTHVRQRGLSLLRQYGKPIITASATIFEPGFQAGQVVQVKSAVHGLDETLVIRQLTLRIVLARGTNRGIPSYTVEMGLDPEDAWNFYDALPFVDSPYPAHEVVGPTFWSYGQGGAIDEFDRVVATTNLPSGWGTGDIGVWEESTSSYHYEPGRDDYVDGSVGVIDLRRGEVVDLASNWTAWAPAQYGPIIVTDSLMSPPFDVYLDFRLDSYLDAQWFAAGWKYWGAQFGIASPSAAYMASSAASATNPARPHNVSIWGSPYPFRVMPNFYTDSSATTLHIYIRTWFSSGGYYQESSMPFVDFLNKWWRMRFQVTYAGAWLKLWLRDDPEPTEWTAWDYGDIERHDNYVVGQSPDRYSIVGLDYLEGVNFNLPLVAHDWMHNPYGVGFNWALPDPGDAAYAVSFQTNRSESFGHVGTPEYGMGIVWGNFEAPPVNSASHWGGQSLASWWDSSDQFNGNTPNTTASQLISVRVTGRVGVAHSGWPWGSNPNPAGSVEVIGEQFFYGETLPGTAGETGDAKNPGNPYVVGGVGLFTVECAYVQGQPVEYHDIDFTVTTFSDPDDQFQWGVRAIGMWDAMVADGGLYNGFLVPLWGGLSVVFDNLVYTPTYELHPIPPAIGGRFQMDNLEIVGSKYGMVAQGWGCETVRPTGSTFKTTNPVVAGSLQVMSGGKILIEHVDWEAKNKDWQTFTLLKLRGGLLNCCYLGVWDQPRVEPSVTRPRYPSRSRGKDSLANNDIHGV